MDCISEFASYRPQVSEDYLKKLISNGVDMAAASWLAHDMRLGELNFYRTVHGDPFWNMQTELDRLRDGEIQAFHNLLQRWLLDQGIHPLDATVLEFGAGVGGNLLYSVDAGLLRNVTFYEVNAHSRAFLEYRCNQRRGNLKVLQSPTLEAPTLEDLVKTPHAYDVILAYTVFEHLSAHELGLTLKALSIALRPRGVLMMNNCFDDVDGEFPMHHTYDPQKLFADFGASHRIIEFYEQWQLNQQTIPV